MMTSWINFLLFLVLQLCFLSTATTNEHDDHPLPTVYVINALPKSSKAMNVSCSSNNIDIGEQSLVNGEVYKWRVSKRKLHYCVAIWERFFASWHAFQPRRDGNHETLFWMVEEDGFFISWDKAKWVRKYRWETEWFLVSILVPNAFISIDYLCYCRWICLENKHVHTIWWI